MKKLFLVLILIFVAAVSVSAQSTTEYKLKNGLIGFGVGSRQQGDLESAKWLLISDISGLTLMTVGGVGLILTNIAYEYLLASYGKVTTADFWINGSILGIGTAIFVTGRVFGIILPDKFVITENADITTDVSVYDYKPQFSFNVQLRF